MKEKNIRVHFPIENAVAFLCSGLCAFVFLFNASINIWKIADVGTDSSVFKTVTLMMEHGMMPYKDSFDHKGPLLYIINYVGNLISGYRGIWVIELIFLSVTIFFIYKISRLTVNIGHSVIVTFVSLSLLFPYFEGGNLTEEYAMTFIAVALWIFLDYFINEKVTFIRLSICGFCMGAVLMLRANMITVWICFAIAVLVKTVREKKTTDIPYFIGAFTFGLLVITVPVAVWLAKNDALKWCWNAYIHFNKIYISGAGERAVFKAKWNTFFSFLNTTVYLFALSSQVYQCANRKRLLDIAYLVYMLLGLVFICLSGMTFPHYGMILVPSIAYPISHLFSLIDKIEIKGIRSAVSLLLCMYLLAVVALPAWISLIAKIPAIYDDREKNQRSDLVKKITEVIEEKTVPDQKISVYGNWDIIYVTAKRMHATRYSYQFPIGTVMPQIMNEYIDGLKKEIPSLIVIQKGHYDENIKDFLEDNNYSIYWSQNGDSLDGALVFCR